MMLCSHDTDSAKYPQHNERNELHSTSSPETTVYSINPLTGVGTQMRVVKVSEAVRSTVLGPLPNS